MSWSNRREIIVRQRGFESKHGLAINRRTYVQVNKSLEYLPARNHTVQGDTNWPVRGYRSILFALRVKYAMPPPISRNINLRPPPPPPPPLLLSPAVFIAVPIWRANQSIVAFLRFREISFALFQRGGERNGSMLFLFFFFSSSSSSSLNKIFSVFVYRERWSVIETRLNVFGKHVWISLDRKEGVMMIIKKKKNMYNI